MPQITQSRWGLARRPYGSFNAKVRAPIGGISSQFIQGQISSMISISGLLFGSTFSRIAPGQIGHSVTLPAGRAGIIFSGGVGALIVGHGFNIGDIINVHWIDPIDGITAKSRRGLTIDNVMSISVWFDEVPAGIGDALPAIGTNVVISRQVTITTNWDGNTLEMIAVKSTQNGIADFLTDSGTLILEKLVAEQAFSWINNQGIVNPYAGLPVKQIKISNGSTNEMIFLMGLLYESLA